MRVYVRGAERWEIALDGQTLVERRGVGGGIEETVHEVSSLATAKWELDRRCRAQVAVGFERVAGSDDIAAPSQEELLAAIRANPDDLEIYPVFADYLSDRGDPWGKLIAVQHALAQLPRFGDHPHRDALYRESMMLQFIHASRLWGRLGETIVDEATQRYAWDLFQPTWWCGFLRSVRLTSAFIQDIAGDQFGTLVASLASLQIAAVLREIELAGSMWPAGTLESIAQQTWPCLEKLTVYRAERYPEDFPASRVLPLVEGTVAPSLRHLSIATTSSTDELCLAIAASPIAPRLRHLLLVGAFTPAAVTALADAPFAELAELRLAGTGLPGTAARDLDHCAHKVKITRYEDDGVELQLEQLEDA
jgi:uncharacterized protein (TIGR02996 family)